MINLHEYTHLTDKMFSAALGTSTWFDFLSVLSRHADGVKTHLFGFDTEANVSLEPILNDYDPGYIETYNTYYGQINAWAPGFAKHQVGVAIDSDAMCPPDILEKTEFYNDWVKPQEDICQGGGALLFRNDTGVFVLGGNISRHRSEKSKTEWLQLVNLIAPQLQHAFQMTRALAGAKLETAIVASEGLRSVPGIVLLSQAGRVAYANPTAQTMLDHGTVVTIGVGSSLSYWDGSAQQRVDASFLRGRITAAKPSLATTVVDPVYRKKYSLRFARLTTQEPTISSFGPILALSQECTLLLITEESSIEERQTLLRQRYGLTEAEAKIAAMMGDGQSNDEIAEARDVSVFTIRNQVKSVMNKTGTHRQAEVVRLVAQLPAGHSLFGS